MKLADIVGRVVKNGPNSDLIKLHLKSWFHVLKLQFEIELLLIKAPILLS